jgi:WD40 repeat protein
MTFPPVHESQVECVAAAPDGSWVVSGDFLGAAWVHDVKGLRAMRSLVGHTKQICAAAASPDGTRAATASTDGTVRIWDPRSGKCQFILEHHVYTTAVAFSPEGRWVYTGSGDGRLCVWDAGTGAYIDEIVVDGVPQCIAPRGDLVWVGCQNSTISVYRHTPLPAK